MQQADNEANIKLIISSNNEEWNRLLFLLGNPEGNSVFWVNCDTYKIKAPLHDALSEYLPQLKPFDIRIDEHTISLKQTIGDNREAITSTSIIHVLGIEGAVRSDVFLENLNFQRDSFFRDTPANIIIWGDFASANILSHKTYDFWSWVSLNFDFVTPDNLLSSRQREFGATLKLSAKDISIPDKEGAERIRHLQQEWDEFLKSVKGKPSNKKLMLDAITIAKALAREYQDEGKYRNGIAVLKTLLQLQPELIDDVNLASISSELCILHRNTNQFIEAEKYGKRALELGLKNHEPISETATFRSNLALVYMDLRQFHKAKDLLEQSLNTYMQLAETIDSSALILVQNNLAMVYLNLLQYDRAKILMDEVLKKSIEKYGDSHQSISTLQSNLSVIYGISGDFQTAKKLLGNALEIDFKNYGENHPVTANHYYNLAHLSKDMKDIKHARLYMKKAYEIFKTEMDEDSPTVRNAKDFLKRLNHS